MPTIPPILVSVNLLTMLTMRPWGMSPVTSLLSEKQSLDSFIQANFESNCPADLGFHMLWPSRLLYQRPWWSPYRQCPLPCPHQSSWWPLQKVIRWHQNWWYSGLWRGCLRLLENLDQMEKWTGEWRIEFNSDKCEMLYLGKLNQDRTYIGELHSIGEC